MSGYLKTKQYRLGGFRAAILAAAALLPATAALAAPKVGVAPTISTAAIGRTDSAQILTLSLYLPSRDPAGLASFLAHISKRGDPLYRSYLTPAQYEDRFGASAADYAAVLSWASSHGLVAGEYFTGRHVVALSGSTKAMEAAFGTQFNDYRDANGKTFYAATKDVTLPAEISGRVAGVVGLSGQVRFANQSRILPKSVKPYGIGTGVGGGFSSADLTSIYDIPVLAKSAPGQVLAVFEQGGFTAADVSTYVTANKLRAVPLKVRNVDGWDGSVDDADVEAEAVLDIDMQNAMNPTAKRIWVYEEGKNAFSVALVNSLAAMAKDDKATSIDISYGTDESIQGSDAITAENGVLEQMTGEGMTIFASAGDQGAFGRSGGGLNVEDPCTQPFITCVGGTTVFPGQNETYGSEEVWNDLGAGYGATGGGISTAWTIPGWQQPGGYSVTTLNGGSSTMRNVPDVAAVGNPLTGVSVYSAINGGWIIIGGTSVSAPIWSGYYSLLTATSQALGLGTPGFANPGIYDIQAFGGLVQTSLNDVQDGYNGASSFGQVQGFFAGAEYDNTTGWGTPLGRAFEINYLVPPNGNGQAPAAPTNFTGTAKAKSITLNWAAAAGATGYAILVTNETTASAQTQSLVTGTTATFDNLTPGTSYYFQLFSVSKGGNAEGNDITVTTTGK